MSQIKKYVEGTGNGRNILIGAGIVIVFAVALFCGMPSASTKKETEANNKKIQVVDCDQADYGAQFTVSASEAAVKVTNLKYFDVPTSMDKWDVKENVTSAAKKTVTRYSYDYNVTGASDLKFEIDTDKDSKVTAVRVYAPANDALRLGCAILTRFTNKNVDDNLGKVKTAVEASEQTAICEKVALSYVNDPESGMVKATIYPVSETYYQKNYEQFNHISIGASTNDEIGKIELVDDSSADNNMAFGLNLSDTVKKVNSLEFFNVPTDETKWKQDKNDYSYTDKATKYEYHISMTENGKCQSVAVTLPGNKSLRAGSALMALFTNKNVEEKVNTFKSKIESCSKPAYYKQVMLDFAIGKAEDNQVTVKVFPVEATYASDHEEITVG